MNILPDWEQRNTFCPTSPVSLADENHFCGVLKMCIFEQRNIMPKVIRFVLARILCIGIAVGLAQLF